MAQPPPFIQQNGRTPSASSMRSLLSQGTPGRLGTGSVQLNESDNIKVAIRIRPNNHTDRERASVNVLQVYDATTLKVVVPGPAKTTMTRDFTFHACLGPEVMQPDVLTLCGVPQLLDAALAGYNVTIFAYGQTGSGKTYTMSGREDVIETEGYAGDMNDGIITRSVNYLYNAIAERARESRTTLSASYLEIYNEGIYDLLNLKAKNLPVKWDAGQGFFVPGLHTVECANMPAMLEVIRTGMRHRHVGSHELNIESSRSHSIMTIACHCRPTGDGSGGDGAHVAARFGKISFVDLAGSERLKDTKSEGVMLKETANINKSLFVLGKVIAALADRDSAGISSHIPYRDSKLTKLLMDSLGGSALALMIACCSPSAVQLEETLSTLSYATRAKNITNRPTVQFDPKEAATTALRREIELLRSENAYLRDQMSMSLGPIPLTPTGAGSLSLNHSLRSQLALINTNGGFSSNSSLDLSSAFLLEAPDHHHPSGSPSPYANTNSFATAIPSSMANDSTHLASLLSCARRNSGSIMLASLESSPGSVFGSGFGNGELGSRKVLGSPLAVHTNPSHSILAGSGGSLPAGSNVQAGHNTSASNNLYASHNLYASNNVPGATSAPAPVTDLYGNLAHGGGSSPMSSSIDYNSGGAQPGSSSYTFGGGSGTSSSGLPPQQQQQGGYGSISSSGSGLMRRTPSGNSSSLAGGGSSSTYLPQRPSSPPIQEQDLLRRLKDTQNLLSRFSEENSRLAKENDKLKVGRSTLSEEHADVLDEIDSLRGKLADLEMAVVTGAASPAAARSLLLSGMHAGAAGSAGGGGARVTGSGHGSARARISPDGSDILSAATAASVAAYYSGSNAENPHHNLADQARGTQSHEHTDPYAYPSTNGSVGSGNASLNQSLTNHHPISHHPITGQAASTLPSSNPTSSSVQSPVMNSPDVLPRLRYSIMTARPASLNDIRVPHAGLGEIGGLPAAPGLYNRSGTSFPGEDVGGGGASPSISLLPPGHPSWGTEGQTDPHISSSASGLHPSSSSYVTQYQDQLRRNTADPSRPQQQTHMAAANVSATGRIAALLAEADQNSLLEAQQQQSRVNTGSGSYVSSPSASQDPSSGSSVFVGGGSSYGGDRSPSGTSSAPSQQQQWPSSGGSGQRPSGPMSGALPSPIARPDAERDSYPWRSSSGSAQGAGETTTSAPGTAAGVVVGGTGGVYHGSGPHPPLRTPGGSMVGGVGGGGSGRGGSYAHHGSATADVLSIAAGPGAAMRTRQAAGRGHSYGMIKPKVDDSLIIVADPAKLSLLLD